MPSSSPPSQANPRRNISDNSPPPKWTMITGMCIGLLVLIFLMFITYMNMQDPTRMPNNNLILMVLSFGTGMASAFLGGSAAASGALRLPHNGFANTPIKFGATGGVGAMLVIWIVG